MSKLPISLRAASPSIEEGEVFARYLDKAAEGFFRFMLGRRSVQIIATAFVQPGHDLSYQYVTFAWCRWQIVGMISANSAEQHRQSSDEPLKRAAGRQIVRMAVVSLVCAPLLRAVGSMDAGDFYIQAMAVEPEVRGEGVGSALLDSVEESARAAGSTRLCLDVSAGNVNARRLYERRGMVVVSRWPRRLTVTGLKILRMAKPLL